MVCKHPCSEKNACTPHKSEVTESIESKCKIKGIQVMFHFPHFSQVTGCFLLGQAGASPECLGGVCIIRMDACIVDGRNSLNHLGWIAPLKIMGYRIK